MKLLISENDIKKRVKSLGKQINEDYKGKKPIFVGILNAVSYTHLTLPTILLV